MLIGALYGGFFGAGLGIVVLALMGLVMSETLSRINAVKQTVSLTTGSCFHPITGSTCPLPRLSPSTP